jgi:hypothetical protein
MSIGYPHICYSFDDWKSVLGKPSCVSRGEEVLPLCEANVIVEMVFVVETGTYAGTVSEAGSIP